MYGKPQLPTSFEQSGVSDPGRFGARGDADYFLVSTPCPPRSIWDLLGGKGRILHIPLPTWHGLLSFLGFEYCSDVKLERPRSTIAGTEGSPQGGVGDLNFDRNLT